MSVLTDCLREIAEREFPSCTLSKGAAFLPMHSLDTGELSTSAAVEIARVTKQRAERVAERLISALSGHIRGTWRNDNGYVVCSGLEAAVLLSEVYENVSDALESISGTVPLNGEYARSVWCLVPDSSEPVYARLRLLSRAVLQGLLTVTYSGEAHMTIVPFGSRSVRSAREVLELFQGAVEWVLEHEGEVRRDVALPEESYRGAVWTTHHYHERLLDSSKKTLARLRELQRCRITMPADGWLLSRDRALLEILAPKSIRKVVARLHGHDGWLRFLFHLASTTPSGDFDPAVALFNECSSPLWNARSLRDRFSRFGVWLPSGVSRTALTQLIRRVEDYRNLVLAGLFMPVYTARAIVHNEVSVWCAAVERFAREGHAFINAPSTRLALEQGAANDSAREIAAGLGFGLSCIVPLIAEE